MNWPATPVIHLSSENVDGRDNAVIPHRSDVYSWANTGTFATAFTQTDPAQMPLMKKQGGFVSAVSFDGRSDVLACAESKTALSFIHTTGVFSIAIVLRRKNGAKAGSTRIFGAEPKGLSMLFTPYVEGATVEGGYKFFYNNGGASIAALITQIAAPVGEVSVLFIQADGTRLRATQDFWNWESKTFTAGLGTGDASEDYCIGSAGGAIGTDIWAGIDILEFLVWDRLTLDADNDLIRANFDTLRAAP